ncbi:MAG: hypothetical protein MR966_06230, partial [Lachnospiraceae bacterium]|nr:hypothetical protein [Lachnospiraceae bacterium]
DLSIKGKHDGTNRTEISGWRVASVLPAVRQSYCTEPDRHRKFCSDACRRLWWNHHPMPEHWKSVRKAVCPVCGKEYKADRKRLMNHLPGHTAFRTPEAQEKAKRKVQNQTNQTAETER